MKLIEVPCEGEIHHIGLDEEWQLHALDHDDEERIAAELGDEPSECIRGILAVEEAEDLEDLLISSAGSGDISMVALLLGVGVNVHKYQDEALRAAAGGGHTEVASLLLGAGSRAWINDALKAAASHGDASMVALLLGTGANARSANVQRRMDEALFWAAANGQLEVVTLLLEAGADIGGFAGGIVEAAEDSGHDEVVELLKYWIEKQG